MIQKKQLMGIISTRQRRPAVIFVAADVRASLAPVAISSPIMFCYLVLVDSSFNS